jgi:hypothetical protein
MGANRIKKMGLKRGMIDGNGNGLQEQEELLR